MINDTKVAFQVHLLDGTVINGAPVKLEDLNSVYTILGTTDSRATVPCNDGTVCLLSADRINYVTYTPAPEENNE